MNAIKATWRDGHIYLSEPADWPEGIQLLVEPVTPAIEKSSMSEDDWKDDPESIAEWEAMVRAIEPPVYTDDERAELARYREECRRFNLEAVRRKMESGIAP